MTHINAVNDGSAWTAARVGGKQAFCFDLKPHHIDCLRQAASQLRDREVATEQACRDDFSLGVLGEELHALAEDLHRGRGLLVVRGFPIDDVELRVLETMFWCFGIQFGDPVSQSVMGDRLGHVIDVTDKDPNARAYRNNRELTLHTDLGDVVSFMCVRKALTGGESWFASALAVHDEMLSEQPELLARLYRGFRWFRSGEHAEGSRPVTPQRVPVLSSRDGWVSCRYVRDYIIEAGVHESGEPLNDEDMAALDCFDDIAHREDVAVRFTLEPGEAVFINNLTVLHARTSFKSHPDPDKKRLLLRLWMSSEDARPSVPELQIFEGAGEQGIPPQPGRTPSYAGRSKPQRMPSSADHG